MAPTGADHFLDQQHPGFLASGALALNVRPEESPPRIKGVRTGTTPVKRVDHFWTVLGDEASVTTMAPCWISLIFKGAVWAHMHFHECSHYHLVHVSQLQSRLACMESRWPPVNQAGEEKEKRNCKVPPLGIPSGCMKSARTELALAGS